MKQKMGKKLLSMMMMLVLVISLTACGNGGTKEETQVKDTESNNVEVSENDAEVEEAEVTDEAEVAIILKTLANPFWVSMKEGIEAEAEAQGIKVDVYAAQSEDDLQGQLNLFETAIAKDYKAIGIAPLSPVNLNTAIANANKNGIYVANIDEKVDLEQLKSIDGSVICFVTTDNVAVGGKAAGFIIDQLPEGGKVAIIEGKAGNASGEDRKNGAKQAFEANDLFEIVDSQPADWDRTKALDVATNIISKNADLKAFYACNDTMALGAYQAVKNAGKEGEILVVGTDGAPEAVESIQAGGLSATVAQDPAEIGAESLRLLLKAIQDQAEIDPNVEPETIPVDSKLVTE